MRELLIMPSCCSQNGSYNRMKKDDLSKRLADNLDPDRSASSHKRPKMNDTIEKQSGACAFAYFDDSTSSEHGNSADD